MSPLTTLPHLSQIPHMEPHKFVSFAISVIDTYSGDFDHLGAFLDSVRLMKTVTDEQNQELLFHIVKSRISGPARAFIPKYCSTVDEIIACLADNIEADTPMALEAKLKAIARDIQRDVAVVRFVQEAEDLVDKLVYAFIVQEKQLVNLAKSNAINVCARIFNVTPDVSSPRQVLHKYVDSVTKPPKTVFN